MNILSFLLLAFCLAVAYVSAYRIGSSRPGLLKSVFLQLAELHVPAANTDVSMRDKLFADMKDAMKSKDKVKLSGVRAILTAIKQREVDERVEVTNEMAIEIMSKLVKQRKESIKSYQDGGRNDLAEGEQLECDVITSYLPTQLSSAEIDQIIVTAIAKVGAATVKDMGKVIAELKPSLLGKADMGAVGSSIRERLGGKK